MIDSLLLSSERNRTVWSDLHKILFSENEEIKKIDRIEGSPTYEDVTSMTRNPQLFTYDGCFHSYLLADVLSKVLFANNDPSGKGLSNRAHQLFKHAGCFNYKK